MRSILILFLCISLNVAAQPVSTIINTQALEMAKAMTKGDSKAFTRFIPADLLKDPENSKKILQLVDSGFTVFKTFGGEIKKIQFGRPAEIVKDGKKWQSALLQTTMLVSPFADAEIQSVLLAESLDEGKHWTFIDLAFQKIKELKKQMPSVLPSLILPKAAAPKITMKEIHQ